MNEPFVLSIETDAGTFQYGFNLGRQTDIARGVAEGIYKNMDVGAYRPHMGATRIVTVALMQQGRVFDVYDGEWSSEKE
jgi:hypothetical protein